MESENTKNIVNINVNGLFDLQVPTGTLLSDALNISGAHKIQAHSLDMPPMPCGGMRRCKKCKVKASGGLTLMSQEEQSALTPKEIEQGVRFACYCSVVGNCRVFLENEVQVKVKSDGELPQFEIKPTFEEYGTAFDIGTTTIAAHLYGKNGELLSKTTSENPQTQYGADVITRIGFALECDENANVLASSVRNKICELVSEMCEKANILPAQIDKAVVVGNTTMLYLLAGRCPKSLSCAPFDADFLFDTHISAKELSLNIENASVYFPPCISAFVGADITSSVLASGMCDDKHTSLLADIGTNGEIALWHEEKLVCCSTAAGPACEGAGITMGISGQSGAIDHVFVDDDNKITAHVIGETVPKGICGSGVIDAIACLLKIGDIDETGFMEDDEVVILPPVVITQKDVRMIQLAKSAICAGIETMAEEKGLETDDITCFYIAGGFGSYLDINSAAHIGLVPNGTQYKAKVLGNAALMGACAMLLSEEMALKAAEIARNAQAVDLSTSSIFNDKYTEGMFF